MPVRLFSQYAVSWSAGEADDWALALVGGRIDEAADYFAGALAVASRDGDLVTIGRCSNNLGIISNLRGRPAEAMASWETGRGAFERAGIRQGVAACAHNLGIAHRQQGALEEALTAADRAVAEAEAARDEALVALAVRGRAEIRVFRGDLEEARRELERLREMRRRLPDPADEAEDLRIEASLAAVEGRLQTAERLLREVIDHAWTHERPQLQAEALRDLGLVLRRSGRSADARSAVWAARAIFVRLGAEAELRTLAGEEWDGDVAAALRSSIEPLDGAQAMADAGRYAELATLLSARPQGELEQSPLLALLCGIAHGRLGRLEVGQRWAKVALATAQALGDRPLELRAVNLCGVMALERGDLTAATRWFTQAQEAAARDNDLIAVGRSANNLGAIANMRGDHRGAVAAYTRALDAFRQAGCDRGIVEAQHNLAIAYRERRELDHAMDAAEAAVREADRLGDRQLQAQAIAGRAEIEVARGAPGLAIRDAEIALAMHREFEDVVRETEDQRILAVALSVSGKLEEAEERLGDVITRAQEHHRPLLVAIAQRDLAHLRARRGDVAGATAAAETARGMLEGLGATGEVAKLDTFLGRA